MLIRQETMTSGERMGCLIMGKKPDRVPVIPILSGFAAVNTGIPIAQIHNNPEKSFWAQRWTQQMYGYDGGPKFGYAVFGAWEVGGEIRYPEGRYEESPVITKHPWDTPEAIEAFEIPEDVSKCGYLPLAIQFYDIMAQHKLAFTAGLGTPFSRVGNACGENKVLRWLRKEPDLVHLALRKMTDFLTKVAEMYVERYGPHGFFPFCGEAFGTNQLISPQMFEKFALPYTIELNERLLGMGIKRILTHICGDQMKNIPYWKQVPFGEPGVISIPPEIPLEVAIEAFGDEHIIAGGPPPQVLLTGSPEEVYEATRKSLEIGMKSPRGYVMMPGCEFPVFTPPINLYAMMKAVKEHGFYE